MFFKSGVISSFILRAEERASVQQQRPELNNRGQPGGCPAVAGQLGVRGRGHGTFRLEKGDMTPSLGDVVLSQAHLEASAKAVRLSARASESPLPYFSWRILRAPGHFLTIPFISPHQGQDLTRLVFSFTFCGGGVAGRGCHGGPRPTEGRVSGVEQRMDDRDSAVRAEGDTCSACVGAVRVPYPGSAPGSQRCGAALGAATHLVESCPVEVVPGPPEAQRHLAKLLVGKEDTRARLANALEDADDVLEVADVEDGELQLDGAEVPDAVGEFPAACVAHGHPVGDPHAGIKNAMRGRAPLRHLEERVLVHVEDSTGCDFDGRLHVEGDGLNPPRTVGLSKADLQARAGAQHVCLGRRHL